MAERFQVGLENCLSFRPCPEFVRGLFVRVGSFDSVSEKGWDGRGECGTFFISIFLSAKGFGFFPVVWTCGMGVYVVGFGVFVRYVFKILCDTVLGFFGFRCILVVVVWCGVFVGLVLGFLREYLRARCCVSSWSI